MEETSLQKIKRKRKEIEKELKIENINYFEWKMIKDYIESKYESIKEKSTL